MKTANNNFKDSDNQNTGPQDEFFAGDGYPNCEGEPCANMADAADTETGDNNATSEPQELTSHEEAAIWKEKYMRISAEYDNYRKRTFKEKLEIIEAGGEDVVRSMLEVLDDMDRALEAIAKTDDPEAIKQGIILIDNKLRGVLKGRGLTEIEAVGRELDTDLHEAVARIAAEDKNMKGKIMDVVQKGYKLREKIIRYAKVVVGQ